VVSGISACRRCEQWESSFILLPPCKGIIGTWNKRFCQVAIQFSAALIWQMHWVVRMRQIVHAIKQAGRWLLTPVWWTNCQKERSTIRLRNPVPGTILARTGAGTGLKMAEYPANRNTNRISGTSLENTAPKCKGGTCRRLAVSTPAFLMVPHFAFLVASPSLQVCFLICSHFFFPKSYLLIFSCVSAIICCE